MFVLNYGLRNQQEESGWWVMGAMKHPWTYSSRLWEGHYLYICSWMEARGYGIFLCVNVKNLCSSHSLHHVSRPTLDKLGIVWDTHSILHPMRIQTTSGYLAKPVGATICSTHMGPCPQKLVWSCQNIMKKHYSGATFVLEPCLRPS